MLRTGAVKAGLWENNEFVEATTVKDCEGTIAATNAAQATARKAAEASNLTAKALLLKVATFPPVIAVSIASLMNFMGIALPNTAAQLVVPLANANNPLVLLTLGVLFKPSMDRMQLQAVTKFISVKYALGLMCAALATISIPQSFTLARGVIAALCVMPVPSIVMQYSADHENDGALAASIVMSSQAMSIALICAFAVVAPHIATIDRTMFSGALAASATGVALLGALSVKALAPSRGETKTRNQPASTSASACWRSSRSRRVVARRETPRSVCVLTTQSSAFVSAARTVMGRRARVVRGGARAGCLLSVRSLAVF